MRRRRCRPQAAVLNRQEEEEPGEDSKGEESRVSEEDCLLHQALAKGKEEEEEGRKRVDSLSDHRRRAHGVRVRVES